MGADDDTDEEEATPRRKMQRRRPKQPLMTGRDIVICVAGMVAMSAIAVVFFFVGTEHNKRQLRLKAAHDASKRAAPPAPSPPAASAPKPTIVPKWSVTSTLRASQRKARHHAKRATSRKKPAKATPMTRKRPRAVTKRAATRVSAKSKKTSAARTVAEGGTTPEVAEE